MSTATESKHTPGPWTVGAFGSVFAKQDGITVTIAEEPRCYGFDRWIANARLIAAAPAMLEKVEKVTAWLDRLAARSAEQAKDTRFMSLSEANAADAKNYRKTADDLRETIKLAKGESR